MASTEFGDYVREREALASPEERQLLAHFRTHFDELHAEHFILGLQLAAARRRQNLTQEQLARLSGIKQPEISRIERGQGNPTYNTLKRLGECLGAFVAYALPSGRLVNPDDPLKGLSTPPS